MFRTILAGLKRFRSQKTVTKVHIVSAALAAVFLSVATWISTLSLPTIEGSVEEHDSTIANRRYRLTQDLVQGLYAMDLQTERRVDFLDQRLESVIVSAKSERASRLGQSAAEKTRDQISQWTSLFRDSFPKETRSGPSALDPDALANQNLTQLESSLVAAKRNAYARLRQTLEDIRTQELQKRKYEDKQGAWDVWFRVTQVVGLVMVVVCGVLDAWDKQKEIAQGT